MDESRWARSLPGEELGRVYEVMMNAAMSVDVQHPGRAGVLAKARAIEAEMKRRDVLIDGGPTR